MKVMLPTTCLAAFEGAYGARGSVDLPRHLPAEDLKSRDSGSSSSSPCRIFSPTDLAELELEYET